MIYKIVHRTTYRYRYPVSVGNHVACLKPSNCLPHQQLVRNELSIQPTLPATLTERIDYFGNLALLLHRSGAAQGTGGGGAQRSNVIDGMDADARNGRAVHRLPGKRPPKSLPGICSPEGLDAYQFAFESPRIRMRPEFAAYALQSFTPGRPMREALLDLTARIHRDFRFDSKGDQRAHPAEEVFKKRRGVCQDFAHVQIACLRSLNLAARYVSGYLRTYPPRESRG
jgi:transglutaminase-like putative cysteine protease